MESSKHFHLTSFTVQIIKPPGLWILEDSKDLAQSRPIRSYRVVKMHEYLSLKSQEMIIFDGLEFFPSHSEGILAGKPNQKKRKEKLTSCVWWSSFIHGT